MKAANYLSKTRRDHDLWDAKINDKWGGVQPVLSPEESLLAAKKLYRHAMGKAWPRKWALTSGRRYTWPRSGVFYVNPDRRGFGTRGLRDIIQLRLEARLTKFALDRRWHEGALKKEPTAAAAPVEKSKPDVVVQRYSRMVGRRDKWKRELERAKRLFAKAESEVRAYERRHRERLSA
jgi:hypothetical protein